jgi:hypothetical protein
MGRDGYHLARAVVQNRTVKSTLLEHARQSNSVAHSLLRVDQQVGLVKYYGLSGYLKQRMQSTTAVAVATSTDDGSSASAPTTTTITSTATNGKVAFMVTASMKQELKERLGYDMDQIKTMTPTQASLILSQSIAPDAMEERLPVAEQEYEAQRKQEYEAQHKKQQEEEVQEQENLRLSTKQEEERMMVDPQHPFAEMATTTTWFANTGGYASRNLLNDPEDDGGFGDVWFEVTETKDGETSRVGLYLDEREGQIGMETRQEIASRKVQNLQYSMHRILRENL